MLQHLNFVTLIGGIIISGMSFPILAPAVGTLVIVTELWRCHRIAKLTQHVPAETVKQFYRGDRARRYFGANSTAIAILRFAQMYQSVDEETI